MSRYPYALAFLLTLSAFTPAAPVPKGRTPSGYFPTRVGAKWVYKVTRPDRVGEVTVRVSAVETKEDGATSVTLGEVREGDQISGQFTVRPDGLYQDVDFPGGAIYYPAICVLKLPHRHGASWATESRVIQSPRAETRTAYGPERVEVPAGRFDAIRVESVYARRPAPAQRQTEWFAPGVGLVKWAVREQVWTLKSFDPGKD